MSIPGLNFINGRLSLGARLGLLSALFVAPTLMLLVMFTTQSWSNISFARLEISGAEYLAAVWPSFTAGVSPGAAGPVSPELAEAQARFDARLGTAAKSAAFAQAASSDARLAAGRELIDAVTNAASLPLDPDADSLALILVTTGSLPSLNADLASLHDATNLAASNPDRQARVAEALQRIRSSTTAAVGQFNDAMTANKDVRATLSAKAEALKAAAARLDAHRGSLLAGAGDETVAADVKGLHQCADDAWRGGQSELHRLLKAREHRLMESLLVNLAIVLTALAIAAGLAAVIALGVSGRIAALLKVMDRLIGGDVAVDVPHTDDRNETGRIAQTVAVFKASLIDAARLRAERAEETARTEDERRVAEADRAASAQQQSDVVGGLAQGLERLAAGVLTFRLNEAFAPSYEKLRADFNAAMEQMQRTICEVATNSAGVRTASTEISQASDNLSRRTEQQAASLEETAAALDQITATVRKTAEGAGQARDAVGSARADAERSGVVVRDAVAAMSEIESSAQQISQIIGVIDEIAFQTNLLALNAGVEAARAGDAGRGFAVVASEVRALAQRSADAAKEIKALISASSQQVERGVNLVGETGKVLERIVTQVTQINGVVTEIAASAEEQSTGLQQVNTAVNQMDQVTQQNAAMVEEATAASHALTSEADTLARLISRFELGAARPQPAPAQAPAQHRPVTAMKTTGHRSGGAALAPAQDSWDEF